MDINTMRSWIENELTIAYKENYIRYDELLQLEKICGLDEFILECVEISNVLKPILPTKQSTKSHVQKCIDRLLFGKPLSPINMDSNTFLKVSIPEQELPLDKRVILECSRMPSLYIKINLDTYETHIYDHSRILPIVDNADSWVLNLDAFFLEELLADKCINPLFGDIAFPYFPTINPYKIHLNMFVINDGYYNLLEIKNVITPEGDEIKCSLYLYKKDVDGVSEFVEINYDEFLDLATSSTL